MAEIKSLQGYFLKDATAREQIAAEQTARQQKDTELQQAITAEQNARTQADATFNEKITTEADNRTQADAALDERITAEQTARTQSDATLDEKITAEQTARTQADATLDEKITAEQTARTQSYNELKNYFENNISGMNEKIGSADKQVNQIFHKNAYSHKIGANDYTYIYIDCVNGNDENAGLTSGTPVRSLERAFYIATSYASEIRFNFMSAGTYNMIWYNINGLSIHFIPLVGGVTIKFNKHCAFYNCHLNFLGYAQMPLTVIYDASDAEARFYLDGGTIAASYTDFQIKTLLHGAYGTYTECTIRHLIVTGAYASLNNCYIGDEIYNDAPWLQATNANLYLKSIKNAMTKNRKSYLIALNFGSINISGSMSESDFICELGSNIYYAHVTSTTPSALETLKNYGTVEYRACVSYYPLGGVTE